ncbi:MAG: oligosaccharide flippase family protein [Bacteroidota bacterium]
MRFSGLLRDVSSASFLIGLGFLAQSGADIYLGRVLPKSDYGFFTLIFRDSVNLISVLALLGFDSALVRFLGEEGLRNVQWKRSLMSQMLIISAAGFLMCVLIWVLYKIPLVSFTQLAVVVVLIAALNLGSSVLRVAGRYLTAQFFGSIWKIIFLVVVIFLFIVGTHSVTMVTNGLVVSIAITTVGLVVLLEALPSGEKPVQLSRLLRDGILFFGLNTSSLMLTKVERFFLGGIEGFKEVGSYYAVYVLTVTAFTILSSGISFVLFPHFARGGRLNLRKAFAVLAGVTLFAAIGYLLFGTEILHLFYRGKYDSASFLIPLLLCLGALQLFYVIPSSYIGAKASAGILTEFLVAALLALGVNVLLSIVLIPRLSILGAAIAAISAWGVRVIAGYIYFFRVRLSETKSASGGPAKSNVE